MSRNGNRIIQSAREALAYVRDEFRDGFVVHAPAPGLAADAVLGGAAPSSDSHEQAE